MSSESSVASSTGKIPTNILRYRQGHPLDTIFALQTIAVIGATEHPGSVGRAIFENLLNSPLPKWFSRLIPDAKRCWESKPIPK